MKLSRWLCSEAQVKETVEKSVQERVEKTSVGSVADRKTAEVLKRTKDRAILNRKNFLYNVVHRGAVTSMLLLTLGLGVKIAYDLHYYFTVQKPYRQIALKLDKADLTKADQEERS